nr:MAG TPA: hypothetical protein [Caudoviricetes sp.]
MQLSSRLLFFTTHLLRQLSQIKQQFINSCAALIY